MKYLGVVLFLLLPAVVQAQSTIGSVEGEVSRGTSITINLATGSFGTKVPAAPMRYENFEDGTNDEFYTKTWATGGINSRVNQQTTIGGAFYPDGNYICSRPKWDNTYQRHAGDTMGLIQNFTNEIDGYRDKPVGISGEVRCDTLYFTAWSYRDDVDGTAINSGNYKPFGNWSASPYPGHPQSRVDQYPIAGGGHLYSTAEDQTDMYPHEAYRIDAGNWWLGQWFRLERFVQVDLASGVGIHSIEVNDGAGPAHTASYTGQLYEVGDKGYDIMLVGTYFERSNGATLKVYWDAFYLDNTQARVELGDASTWSACTHKEIQIPTAWATNEITVTVETGSFSANDAAWLYVVDEDGTVSTGYAVTVGGEEEPPVQDMTAPTALIKTGGGD